MTSLGFENPVFCAYALAAGLMLLKAASHSWLTVARMLKVKGGYRLPEDARRTPLNRNPTPGQLENNDYVERTRRLHQNEVENVPLFLASGLLYVLTAPRFALAATLYGIYVVTRFIHFAIVMLEGTHDARATAWTAGSLILYWMSGSVVVHAARALL
jgi:glutathione S-transferase